MKAFKKELTELINKHSLLPKFYDEPDTMTWHEAMEKYENHPDYRLMTIEELEEQWLNFPDDYKKEGYWSSSEYNSNFARYVYFNSGLTDYGYKLNSVRVRAVLREEEDKVDDKVDDTEYLTSSKANADKLYKAMKEFDKSCDEHLDRIAETEITPKALLKLGFEEEYQPPIDNQAGYLYYSFKMWGIELLSNASDEEGWYVFNDDNQEIHNLRKLGDLITSLKELS